MSKNVFIDLPCRLRWPRKCVACGCADGEMLNDFKTSGANRAGNPLPAPGAPQYPGKFDIHYPVCGQCMEKNKKMEFLSRHLGNIATIAFGATAMGLFLVLRMTYDTSISQGKVYSVFWFIVSVAVCLMAISVWATTKIPVRVHNFRSKCVELVFLRDDYAREFVALNGPQARYISRLKSIIGLKG